MIHILIIINIILTVLLAYEHYRIDKLTKLCAELGKATKSALEIMTERIDNIENEKDNL